MKRSRFVALFASVAVVVALAITATGCTRKVSVSTGERVVCTYGHPVSSSVRRIDVPAGKASLYGVTTKTITCPRHQQAQSAYRDAQEAIKKADLKKAAENLAKVVAIDPAFKQAKSQLADIKAGRTPKPDGSTPSASNGGGTGTKGNGGGTGKPSTPGDDAVTGPIASLIGWMPERIEGFSADKPIADAFAVSREYVPTSEGKATGLVIAAEQFADNKAAKASLSTNVKVPYDVSGKTVDVNGKAGYLGTNRQGTAILGITDGPVLVILQMHTQAEDATSLYDDLVSLAEKLPR